MKNKSYILVLTLLITSIFSCKKGDDLYVSPNSPLAADAKTLLAGIEMGTFNNLEGGAVRISSILIQHNSGVLGQALEPETYALTESDMDNYWTGLYTNMFNCKLLIDNFGAENPYYRALGKIIMVMNLGATTDMWGDIPFSEAFQGKESGGNFNPKYDAQQNILNQIQTMLDEAIVDLARPVKENVFIPQGDDFIYQGDLKSWEKLAYTLKARYYSRLSKKPGFDANLIVTWLSKGIVSNKDNCYAKHGTGGAESNQWADYLNGRGYVVASQVLIDSMGNMKDPRTPFYFDTTLVGFATGNPLGSFNSDVSFWGPYVGGVVPGSLDNKGNFNSTTSKNIPLVTYAEAKFLEAEAKVRLGDASAFTALNDAIKASVSEVTEGSNTGDSIATYTAINTSVHTVILEKWKAMFTQPIEAYSDYRRTGFPILKPNPAATLNYIPKRLIASQQERVLNSNAQTPSLDVPVWYAE